MADEGILADKDEVEGHRAYVEPDASESETADDVEGHRPAKAIGDPRDGLQPGRQPLNSDGEDDVEGHRPAK
jgi:hypothetical protein